HGVSKQDGPQPESGANEKVVENALTPRVCGEHVESLVEPFSAPYGAGIEESRSLKIVERHHRYWAGKDGGHQRKTKLGIEETEVRAVLRVDVVTDRKSVV